MSAPIIKCAALYSNGGEADYLRGYNRFCAKVMANRRIVGVVVACMYIALSCCRNKAFQRHRAAYNDEARAINYRGEYYT